MHCLCSCEVPFWLSLKAVASGELMGTTYSYMSITQRLRHPFCSAAETSRSFQKYFVHFQITATDVGAKKSQILCLFLQHYREGVVVHVLQEETFSISHLFNTTFFVKNNILITKLLKQTSAHFRSSRMDFPAPWEPSAVCSYMQKQLTPDTEL